MDVSYWSTPAGFVVLLEGLKLHAHREGSAGINCSFQVWGWKEYDVYCFKIYTHIQVHEYTEYSFAN